MKTLHLLRHAKAAEGPIGGTDHVRPLAKRGVKSANAMAQHFAATGFMVDKVYCSTARRTRETFDLIAPALADASVAFRDRLYLIDIGDFMDFIHGLPDGGGSVMLIGHNPTFYVAAFMLIKDAAQGHAGELAALKEKFSTGALCSIQFDAARWRDIKASSGTLTAFIRPRDLGVE